jgi:protein ImuA
MHAQQDTDQPTLVEIFPDTVVDGAATGFVLAHLKPGGGPVLWVQDRLSQRESGRPYPAGFDPGLRFLHLAVGRATDVLWAMEQGLGCPSLTAVIGEVWGDAPALDFTATKRLALRAEAHAVPAFLVRRAAQADLSAARLRWRLASLPSVPPEDDRRAPGDPLWRADLFRARWRDPGEWVARHDETGLVLEHGVGAGVAAASGPVQRTG